MILQNKVKSTFMVDGEVYKKIRILAIEKNMEVSALLEEAMREKLEREYQQPQLQLRQQQPQSQEEQKPDLFRYDTKITKDDYNTVFRLTVPRLDFPISKNDLIELSRNNKQEGDFGVLYFAVRKLPKANKTYKNVEELAEDVMMVFNGDMRNSGISKRITKCIILVAKNRKTTAQYLEDERLKRKTIPKTT